MKSIGIFKRLLTTMNIQDNAAKRIETYLSANKE